MLKQFQQRSVLQRCLFSSHLWRVIKSFWKRVHRISLLLPLLSEMDLFYGLYVFCFLVHNLSVVIPRGSSLKAQNSLEEKPPPPFCPLLLLCYLLLNPASVSFISEHPHPSPLSAHLWGLLGGILFSLPAGFVDTQSTYASLSPLLPLFLTLTPHLAAPLSALTEQ